jgi:hypothetical protein
VGGGRGGGRIGRRSGLGMGAVSERDRGGGVDAGDRGCALGVLVLVVAVADLLVDPVLLAARVGQLLGVLEWAVERFAGSLSFEDRVLVLARDEQRNEKCR